MKQALLVTTLVLAAAGARADAPLRTDRDRQSYAVGLELGRKLRQMPVGVDADLVVRGFEDGLRQRTWLLTNEELQAALQDVQTRAKAEQAGRIAAAVGATFQQQNARREGVVTLPSGLQYRVVKAGAGKVPARDSDVVEFQWKERTVDGAEIDSSARRGGPTTSRLDGELLAGWREALRKMPAGSTWELVVPPHLAYGEQGSGVVGPNATLVFDLELVAVR